MLALLWLSLPAQKIVLAKLGSSCFVVQKKALEQEMRENTKVLSTLGVMILPFFERPLGSEVVGWACQMLERGHDAERLRILASLSNPLNEFEIAYYLERTFDELGIPVLPEMTLLASFAFEILSANYESRTALRDALQPISILCIKKAYPSELYKLYLLYHALDSLIDYGDQHYIDGAKLEDIPSLVRELAKVFQKQSVELPFF
jgi:hypothetical protein